MSQTQNRYQRRAHIGQQWRSSSVMTNDFHTSTWIEAKMAKIEPWIRLVEALVRAGADATLRTEEQRLISDYLDDVVSYKGNKRLLVRLREVAEPRWQKGLEMGWQHSEVWSTPKSN